MRRISLQSETDWDGWRAATRALVLAGVPPDQVQWHVAPKGAHALPDAAGSFGISRALVALAGLAIQARDPRRFEVLYRVVWRAHNGERVLEDRADPDARLAQGLALAVRAEQHRMRTQLRYLPVHERGGTRYVGWYRPAHFVLEADAQLLSRRFVRFVACILTPEGSAHWDQDGLRFGPGVDPAS